ncbi:DUF7691 family protein [Kitasatospora brasiliensis]|uniref:DUF7691 family protein n=1 Tax=Kitasatospora brasiliensis TaxID=3058040 RepID=UPI00292D3B38|nr:hypothetical protein [Kitasatospora sp. K002]
MSSFLSAYLVDPAELRARVGSGNDGAVDEALAYFGPSLDRSDEHFTDEIAQGAPTAREALRAVVHGGPYSEDEDHAFQYGYAYRRLCWLVGQPLEVDSFGPFRGNWLDVVDEGLKAYGITAVSVAEFQYAGLPGNLPSCDVPSCGTWSAADCREALEQFEQAEREGRTPVPEREVAEAVAEVVGWLRLAQRWKDGDIVGFVS